MVNLLVKVFYDGTLFHGSQRQPSLRTVEGEIIRILNRLNINYRKLVASGRTDKGVHALSQVFMIELCGNSEDIAEDVVYKLSTELPEDIVLWAYRVVSFEFNPRFNANYRRYLYVKHVKEFNVEKAREIARKFIGRHNFKCFSSFLYSNVPEFMEAERTIIAFNVFKMGNMVVYDISANSFLRQMVRRIIPFIELYVKGKRSREDLDLAFKGICDVADVKLARPGNLILFDVDYFISFKVIPENMKRMRKYWLRKYSTHVVFRFLHDFVDFRYGKPFIKLAS
ncbi:MAG: tRNA pseudouridine(38-40) synthase TruA [Thermoprotei archaeon]|nr:MAG: tRNA pseudouridine(38-40) synthase TruA [Thermoprotei archaeon]